MSLIDVCFFFGYYWTCIKWQFAILHTRFEGNPSRFDLASVFGDLCVWWLLSCWHAWIMDFMKLCHTVKRVFLWPDCDFRWTYNKFVRQWESLVRFQTNAFQHNSWIRMKTSTVATTELHHAAVSMWMFWPIRRQSNTQQIAEIEIKSIEIPAKNRGKMINL